MKIYCEVCEKAEGEVLCCADEAVLCGLCDQKVHSANKLSIKHHRLSLLKHSSIPSSSSSSSSSSKLPICDICQERNGYFFCLEDRAILCKKCDVSIHHHQIASSNVASHQRFLIGGIKVSLDSSHIHQYSSSPSSSSSPLTSASNSTSQMNTSLLVSGLPTNIITTSTTNTDKNKNNNLSENIAEEPYLGLENATTSAAATWPLDEILGDFNDFNYYDFSDMESSGFTAQ